MSTKKMRGADAPFGPESLSDVKYLRILQKIEEIAVGRASSQQCVIARHEKLFSCPCKGYV